MFPLYVNADTPVPIGEWTQAVAGPPGKQKGVASKIGDLAYRPGWHAGEYPFSHHIGAQRVNGKPTVRRPEEVWAEVEMPDDVNWQDVANSRARIKKDGTPEAASAHITDQIPFGGHYRYRTNSNMTGDWMISGDMRVNRVLTDDEVAAINKAAGYEDLPRREPFDYARHGWGAPPASSNLPATMNIGLKKGRTGELYSAQEALDALRDLGIDVRSHEVRLSGTEPTLVATTNRGLTADDAAKLAPRLEQEAFAQKIGDRGELLGPKADEWGPFNEDFFINPTGEIGLRKNEVQSIVGGEGDIAQSLLASRSSGAMKGEPVQFDEVLDAIKNRAKYRSEPRVTPGPRASDDDWAQWGAKHGVNMTVTAPAEVAPGIRIPGGLDGTFTIPDLFWIKANNFDPKKLPREVHDALMQKLMRTYSPNGVADDATIMRALNFTQLSPNTPLLQNEFMSQRLRQSPGESLLDLANARRDMAEQPGGVSVATGIQGAARGGMGLRGTADPEWMTTTAEVLNVYPELFRPRPGETMHDVAQRLTTFLPGIGQKTSSLGVPFFDLTRANTSAVDLHMIRNNWERLLTDPQVGDEFRTALARRLKIDDASPEAIKAEVDSKGKNGFVAVRSIIESQPTAQYRAKKTGEYNERVPAAQRNLPGELEPAKTKVFNPFYNRIVDYVNESAAQTGSLPLFLEQWRLWDTYRGRFEPHEFAHPDWEKLPKQSWSEMHDALKENRKAGFAQKKGLPKDGYKGDWKKLYYGNASPDLLALLAAGGAGGAAAYPLLKD